MAKILIVDDSKTSRRFLKDMLVSAGHAAGDGHRTLAAADIVLLDQALGIFAHSF